MRRATLWAAGVACALTLTGRGFAADAPGERTEWTVDGVEREALVIAPAKTSADPAPVVLVFHGHGGTMASAAGQGFPKHWPEAYIVCPQGLPTVTGNDPAGTRSGWQPKSGDNQDRDLKFVDAVLKTLKDKHKVDPKRVYATGHSNGGGFTYLLWVAGGAEFAAFAPSAAGGGAARGGDAPKPKPVLHVAGETDATVAFENQRRTMDRVKKLNGCDPDGKPWAKAGDLVGTQYVSKAGAPFVAVIHPGGHKYPAEAPGLIVKFFKEHPGK